MNEDEGQEQQAFRDRWDGRERRALHPDDHGATYFRFRSISISVIAVFVVQTISVVWWLAKLSANVERTMEAIAEFRVKQYTTEDARRDQALIDSKLELARQRDREFDRRLVEMEALVRFIVPPNPRQSGGPDQRGANRIVP